MMPALSVQNLLAWIAQVSIIASVGAVLAALFSLRHPRSHLIYCNMLLVACIALPFIQPWNDPGAAAKDGQSIATSLTVAGGSLEKLTVFGNQVFLWILLAGFLARLTFFLGGLFRIRRYRKFAVPLQFPKESVLATCRLIEPEVTVGVSAAEIGPVTFGWRRPMILLPASFLSLDEDAQRAILCHEFLHVLRNDWLTTIVEELIGAFLWFQPAIWWLLSETKLAREQRVDSEVVRLTADREPYISALLAMATVHPEAGPIPAPLFLRKRYLMERLRLLVGDHATTSRRLLFSYGLMGAIIGLSASMAFSTFPLMAANRSHQSASRLIPSANPVKPQVETYTLENGVTPPRVRTFVNPGYSDAARQARIQGNVLLEGIVQTDGTITNLRVAKSLESDLDRNAIAAVKAWRFDPGTRNGAPVPVKLVVEVSFNLK
jgi:bla regulator protein blaR1